MPGGVCPKCNQQTFYEIGYKGECSKCGYKMTVPPNGGKGGKGQKCYNCKLFTVFNGKCTKCGARYE